MISIVYITNRKDCFIKWFLDSLRNQYKKDFPLQVIFVDFWKGLSPEHDTQFRTDFCESIHVEPLPSFCQGKHKLTKENWFSATIARNTGLVYASRDFVYFIDDLSVLLPGWLDAAKENSRLLNGVIQTSYRKDSDMLVENGILISSTTSGMDSRHKYARGRSGRADWCYGNIGLPLDLALKVNGWDEFCSITGYEDCQFGQRLGKAEASFIYDVRMVAVESHEAHFIEGNYFKRQDPETSKERYTEILNNFGCQYRPPHNGRHDASHIITELPKQKSDYRAYWNNYDLRELRRKREAGQEITVEDMKFQQSWWFDGKPLSELS